MCISSNSGKMSQSQEKDSKNGIVVAESGNECSEVLKDQSGVGIDGQAYNETKKTWRSFFWSSKHSSTLNEHEQTSL